jgi:5-methylcytosine-specific restriction endonuclease McrA
MLRSSIISTLRRAWLISPERAECLRLFKTGPNQYKCNICYQVFNRTHIQVDHIDPVGKCTDKRGNQDWNQFISRLFCDVTNLQVLCKPCHQSKTQGS